MTLYKGLMIILDGLGDRGIPGFGGRTPLEIAATPNMDSLASAGQCGLIDPLSPGMPVGTHTGMSLLFGLPRKQALKLARGPVEASGIGFSQQEHALYIRCNFATLEAREDGYGIIDRRAGRIDEGFKQLATDAGVLDLGDGITASLHPATQHRVVLKLSGERLSPRISNTDPGNHFRTKGVLSCAALDASNENAVRTAAAINRFTDPGNHFRTKGVLSCAALDASNENAVRTAAAINRFTDQVYTFFSQHPVNQLRQAQGLLPANGVICRSPGKLPKLNTLLQHHRISAAVVSGEETVLGLGNLFGYTQYRDPGFTALPVTDLRKKIAMAQTALADHDLVFLHIKGPDICSHDLDPVAKGKLLSEIDDAIAPLLTDNLVIAITGDHSTDSNSGRHTGDPVPGLVCGPRCRKDNTQAFNESACSAGGLGRIDSSGFLLTVLDHMNRLDNLKPEDREFFL